MMKCVCQYGYHLNRERGDDENRWLLIILPIVFFGCNGNGLRNKPDETSIPKPITTPTPIKKIFHDSCIRSSSVEKLGMSFPLKSELSPEDFQERREIFQDTLSINAEIVNQEVDTE